MKVIPKGGTQKVPYKLVYLTVDLYVNVSGSVYSSEKLTHAHLKGMFNERIKRNSNTPLEYNMLTSKSVSLQIRLT